MTHPPKNSRPRSLAYRLNLLLRQTRHSNPGVSAIPCRPSLMKATSSSTKWHQPRIPHFRNAGPCFADLVIQKHQIHRFREHLGDVIANEFLWDFRGFVKMKCSDSLAYVRAYSEELALRSSEEVISCRPVLLFARVPGLGPQPLGQGECGLPDSVVWCQQCTDYFCAPCFLQSALAA